MKVYFDNASSTKVDSEVLGKYIGFVKENYANSSSIHSLGQKSKSYLEQSRNKISKILNVKSSELYFVPSGTIANNIILQSCKSLGITRIMTSKIEHHSVLNTVEYLKKEFGIKVIFTNILGDGNIDLQDLESKILSSKERTLVSLMFVNNEIGNILNVKKVSSICKQNNALFHSDMVQALGKINLDLSDLGVDFVSFSSHKIHSVKGTGIMYFNKKNKLKPLFFGGLQEKEMLPGTENIASIFAMSEALEIATNDFERNQNCILEIKNYCIKSLKNNIKNIEFYGDLQNSVSNILNISLPINDKMIVFKLSMRGVFVSSGSACMSGSSVKSHVVKQISNLNNSNIRVSFSKYSTIKEVDFFVKNLIEILG